MTRQSRPIPLEYKHFLESENTVVGVDEAGRGSLFGPVTIATVAISAKLWQTLLNEKWTVDVRDSKKISPKKRERLFGSIVETVPYSVSHVSVAFIDKYNINIAVQYGLYRSVLALQNNLTTSLNSCHLLMDGNYNFTFPHLRMSQRNPNFFPVQYIPHGDDLSFAIGAASIVAKVSRDTLMQKAHLRFPNYALDKHKGYGTEKHRQMLQQYGTSKFHRKTFVRKILKY